MSEERRKNEEKKPDLMGQDMKDFDVRAGRQSRHNLPWWKEIAQILRRNTKSLVIVILAAVVLLGAGIFLGAMIGRGNAEDQTASGEMQTAETESQSAQAEYVPLEENAYPEINALIERYYQAAADGDIDTINSIKDYSEQTELLQIREKSA